MTEILELQPSQARQYIDAESIFLELRRVKLEAKELRGSMFWKREGGGDYLIRESSKGAQKSLGPRSSEKEAIYGKFVTRKEMISKRLATLSLAAEDQQRLNKALRVGRVPNIVVKTLNALEACGLDSHFRTIGTHALYAYETACAVRVMPDLLATQDIDLLFDSQKRMAFAHQLKRLDSSFIGALQKADPSFRTRSDQKQTAVNAAGFEIDVIRRFKTDKDLHPFRMSESEDDLWAVQIKGADRMLSAKKFSQVVVSVTGHMAVMHTMDPQTFVAIKRLVSASPDRDPKKRRKDALQADLVEHLIESRMPQYLLKPKEYLALDDMAEYPGDSNQPR